MPTYLRNLLNTLAKRRRVQKSTECIASSICSMRVLLTAIVVRLEVESCLINEADNLNVVRSGDTERINVSEVMKTNDRAARRTIADR